MSLRIRPFRTGDDDQVIALWEACGLVRPWNDPRKDIERKLAVQPELFLVAVLDETAVEAVPDPDGRATIVGSVMAGYDGHRGWLYYLAADPGHRGAGIARRLVTTAEDLLTAMGCPKVQLMVRPENTAARGFYAAMGYEPFETWATGKRLIADD
jgi:ribosomal protein S18 acetylase RimI-like enzyme